MCGVGFRDVRLSYSLNLRFEMPSPSQVAPHVQILLVSSLSMSSHHSHSSKQLSIHQVGAGMGYTMCIIFLGYGLAFWFGMTL